MAHLLDTSALLAHFRNEAGSGHVQALFEREEEEILLASVSLPEFARRLRDLGSEAEEVNEVLDRYREALTEIVPIDAAVASASFDLICHVPARIPLVDALIAAAAQSRQAILVHRDAHMRAIPPKLLSQLDLEHPHSPLE